MAPVMLSATELAGLQADYAQMLVNHCTIRRQPPRGPWTDLATGVPCLVETVGGGREFYAGGRVVAVAPYLISLPAGQDVTTRDQIIVTDLGQSPRTFAIQQVGGGSEELLRFCWCNEET